jgi:hypothetical protein
MSKLSTIRSLSPFERRTLYITVLLLPALKIAINVWSYRRVTAVLVRTSQGRTKATDPEQVIAGSVRIVRAAANYRALRATCLTRSMALWWLLRRQGIESEIRFGVKRGDDGIAAHAWVEQGRRVLNDRADVRKTYAAFEFDASVNNLEWK